MNLFKNIIGKVILATVLIGELPLAAHAVDVCENVFYIQSSFVTAYMQTANNVSAQLAQDAANPMIDKNPMSDEKIEFIKANEKYLAPLIARGEIRYIDLVANKVFSAELQDGEQYQFYAKVMVVNGKVLSFKDNSMVVLNEKQIGFKAEKVSSLKLDNQLLLSVQPNQVPQVTSVQPPSEVKLELLPHQMRFLQENQAVVSKLINEGVLKLQDLTSLQVSFDTLGDRLLFVVPTKNGQYYFDKENVSDNGLLSDLATYSGVRFTLSNAVEISYKQGIGFTATVKEQIDAAAVVPWNVLIAKIQYALNDKKLSEVELGVVKALVKVLMGGDKSTDIPSLSKAVVEKGLMDQAQLQVIIATISN